MINEISCNELNKLNEKSFKRVQKGFRKRLRQIAADGYRYATFDRGQFHDEDKICQWLSDLGSIVKRDNNSKEICIFWPEHTVKTIKYQPYWIPIPARNPRWDGDLEVFCTGCGAVYSIKTPYCPHCGEKMRI